MFASMITFPSWFGELDRLRRELDDVSGLTGLASSIRSTAPGAFPAINVGNTSSTVEIFAFAPGINPEQIELTIDRGVLSISGDRPSGLPANDGGGSVFGNERFAGTFRRAISLPEDVDPSKVEATYRDGMLRVSIQRRESALPKRINVQ